MVACRSGGRRRGKGNGSGEGERREKGRKDEFLLKSGTPASKPLTKWPVVLLRGTVSRQRTSSVTVIARRSQRPSYSSSYPSSSAGTAASAALEFCFLHPVSFLSPNPHSLTGRSYLSRPSPQDPLLPPVPSLLIDTMTP